MIGTHIPVLLEELVACLRLAPGASVLDATVGLGGHAAAVLARTAPDGRLLGIERTDEGVRRARLALAGFGGRATVARGDFRDAMALATDAGFGSVDAAYFDLGLASWQLDEGYQGLSFQVDAPLDMRVTPSVGVSRESTWTRDDAVRAVVRRYAGQSAAEIVAHASEAELGTALRELGGVRQWRTVATQIVAARSQGTVRTTTQLAAATGSDSPSLLAPVFQALRILVNDEYGAIEDGLRAAWQLLRPGGTLAVISFHSGEHRIVKQLFRELPGATKPTRVFPSEQELATNPRARSATLRFIHKQPSEPSREE